jgi:hypothetical protein
MRSLHFVGMEVKAVCGIPNYKEARLVYFCVLRENAYRIRSTFSCEVLCLDASFSEKNTTILLKLL